MKYAIIGVVLIGVLTILGLDIDSELRALVAEGKKVQAVKKVRMVLGLSLLEAKEYVDSL